MKSNPEPATFAGGSFWELETALSKINGVLATRVGYMGGTTDNPTYAEVESGTTGHSEVVQCLFDPDITPYEDLLKCFFELHDPHSPSGEEGFEGAHYRSEIFVHSPDQKITAERVIQRLSQQPDRQHKILTKITPAGPFYAAEECHQQFLAKMAERYSRQW